MAKKIKIALIIRGFHYGGIEKVFEVFFAKMDLSPYEIHFVTNLKNNPERKKVFERMGCVVHELSPMKGHRFSLKNVREYRDLMKEGHFDIVHCNAPDNLLPLWFAKRYKVPVRILHAHTLYTEGYEKKNPLVSFLFKKGFALNASLATHKVAVSQAAGLSVFGKSGDYVILHNPVDLEKFAFRLSSREKIRAQLGLDGSTPLLGHIGRYENDLKNQEFLIDVFSMLQSDLPQCRLLLVGDGHLRGNYEKRVRDAGLEEKVIFTGAVDNVEEYLCAMDLFLLPSRKEGLGIVAVEAQASGLDCILSEKVPSEAAVLSRVTVLGIREEDKARWVKSIRDSLSGDLESKLTLRDDVAPELVSAGYDIRSQTHILESLYRNP